MAHGEGALFFGVVGLDLSVLFLEEEHPVFLLTFLESHSMFFLPSLVLGVVVLMCCYLCEDNGQEQSQKQGFEHFKL